MISSSNLRKVTFKRRFGVNINHVNKMLRNVSGWNNYKKNVRNQLNRFRQNENVNNATFKKNITNLNRIYKRQLEGSRERIPLPPPLPPPRGMILPATRYKTQNNRNRYQPSRGNSAMSMAPPPLPPKPVLAKIASQNTGVTPKTLRNNFNKSQLATIVRANNVNMALKRKGVPNRVIARMSTNNKNKYAQPGWRFKRGVFGGYSWEAYEPSMNVRARTGLAFKMFGRRVRNLPKKVSRSYHSRMSGFYAGRAEAARKSASLANTKLHENAEHRKSKNMGQWWA